MKLKHTHFQFYLIVGLAATWESFLEVLHKTQERSKINICNLVHSICGDGDVSHYQATRPTKMKNRCKLTLAAMQFFPWRR